MSDDAPAGPSRIIMPGGVKPGTLLGPDGRPLASVTEEPEADAGPKLPEYPRLRALEIQEASEDGRSFIVLHDPTGIAPQPIAISAEALPVLMLLDGRAALVDLLALIDRETGVPGASEQVKKLVTELDERLFLESPRYFEALNAARAAYRAEPVRHASLAGVSYPATAKELTAFLGAHDATARAWRDGTAPAPGVAGDAVKAAPRTTAPRASSAPHIDPRRGGALLARAYLELEGVSDNALPDVYVVFGTGHAMIDEPYAVTAKAYDTPLGRVDTDGAFVQGIVERCGEWVIADELAHREEHSIEFQAVALRHRLGAKPFRIVPILCGGFHALMRADKRPSDDPKVEALLAAVAEQVARVEGEGKRVAFIAGIDLSHVGARFGDAVDLDTETMGDIEKQDRAAIDASLAGDAERWFDAIAAHGDSTRICGFGAQYAMLRAAQPGAGRLLAYEPSLEEGGSVVTYASLAWP